MGAHISRAMSVVSPWRPESSPPASTLTTSATTANSAVVTNPARSTKTIANVPPLISNSDQSQSSIHVAEAALFSQLTNISYDKRLITLPSGIQLNTLSAGNPLSPTLLLLHGWGAGCAFFAPNIAALSRTFRVHLIDWPGFGASTRAPYSPDWTATRAETFFTDALKQWVDIMPTHEPTFPSYFHITAHSLGAYLAVAFALRYPHHVRNLILASPVGIPAPPPQILPRHPSWPVRTLFRLIFVAWEAGYTPQMLIRLAGSLLGRAIARAIIAPRLVATDTDTQEAIVEYFYQISTAPCSAELSLSTILQSGAYARLPLCERLPHLKMPVAFLYGERDWMSAAAAEDVRRSMRVPTDVITVPQAGHHVYFDNIGFFNETVTKACLRFSSEHVVSKPDEQLIRPA